MGDYEGIARRAWRRTTWIAIAGFVVGAVFGALFSDGEDALNRCLIILGFGMSIGGLGGAVSLFPATSKLGPSMQWPVRELDKPQRKVVRRAVFSGRLLGEPGSESAHRAFDFARGAAVSLPTARAQFLLLYAGIGGPQLPNLLRDDVWSGGIARGLVTLLVLITIGITIGFGRQLRGTRRYLAAVGRE
ncbi:hypothetical protein ACRQ4C_06725 [Curtobacterium sp. SP.BCp]|uniref:hypothetical protein n=1 Tax=Curtobacterium sp. SP.BCp TaxID=3435230 RepID=UPI003F73A8A3